MSGDYDNEPLTEDGRGGAPGPVLAGGEDTGGDFGNGEHQDDNLDERGTVLDRPQVSIFSAFKL